MIYHKNAEIHLLKSIMQRPEFLDNWPDLEAVEFFDTNRAKLFRTIAERQAQNKAVDSWIIATDYPEHAATIDEIIEAPRNDTHIGNIRELVRNAYVRRSLYLAGQHIQSIADSERNPTVALDRAIGELNAVSDARTIKTLTTLQEGMEKTEAIIRNPKSKPVLMETGFEGLTLSNGLVTIAAGRPGSGKSCLLLNIAANLAQAGKSVFFASLEDTKHYCNLRILSRFTGIDYGRLVAHAQLDESESAALSNFRQLSKDWNFWIDDSSRQNADTIRRVASMLHSRGLCDVVIIDHLTEMTQDYEAYASTTANTKKVRNLAKDLDIPVLLACQLNRGTESGDSLPKMSNLRDSGKIEEIARGVWLLFRPAYYDKKGADPNQLIVIVEKASHGVTGKKYKHIDLGHMTIQDITKEGITHHESY